MYFYNRECLMIRILEIQNPLEKKKQIKTGQKNKSQIKKIKNKIKSNNCNKTEGNDNFII